MKVTIKATVGEIAASGVDGQENFFDLFSERAYDALRKAGTPFDEAAYLNVLNYEVIGFEPGSVLIFEVEIEECV